MITNFKELATTPLREKALKIINAAYDGIDIKKLTTERICLIGDELHILENKYNLKEYFRVFIVGFGKGSADLAFSLGKILSWRLSDGIVLDVRKPAIPWFETIPNIEFLVGSHPLPSSKNIAAATKIEKLVDNFSSTPGGGHFMDLAGRKSSMQQNVSQTMGTINTVIKSVINLIYDLKDFEIRLGHYASVKSKNKNEAEAGLLALKQVWMDNVDIKRGRGSINMLAQDLSFITLRDAFMAVNSVDDVKKLDLNDRVKRILEARILEFNQWKDLSEVELRKRFNIEKNYLKSQINTLQLYSRWVKPYLKAAAQLEMNSDMDKNPALVTAFNTILLQLTLFGKNKFDFEEAILTNALPNGVKKPKRDYYSCVIVDFSFQGIPQKYGQHYVFGGRAVVNFKAYALSQDEVDALYQELKKADIVDVFKLIEGSTTESLDELKKDIDHFLNKGKLEEEAEKAEKEKDVNPFSALFSFINIKSKEEKEAEKKKGEIDIKKIKKDSYVESIVRNLAKKQAIETCFNVYDVYKKAHGMASHDNPYE